MLKYVTFGTDPEMFVRNIDKKRIVPAFDALGGDIKLPLPFGEAVCDGAAVEYTVDPCDHPDLMVSRIGHNMIAVREYLTRRNSDYVLSTAPNVRIEDSDLARLDDSHGKGSLQVFGCNPDDRVYNLPHISRPEPKGYPYRTSGGHIHLEVGYLATWRPGWSFLIAMLDQTIGVTGTFIADSKEARDRKQLYGKAGYFRTNPDKKTVEYRPLTGQALIQNADLASAMFSAAQTVAQFAVDLFAHEGQQGYVARMIELLGDEDKRNSVALMIDAHDTVKCRKHLDKMIASMPPSVALASMELASLKQVGAKFTIDWDSYSPYLDLAVSPNVQSRREA